MKLYTLLTQGGYKAKKKRGIGVKKVNRTLCIPVGNQLWPLMGNEWKYEETEEDRGIVTEGKGEGALVLVDMRSLWFKGIYSLLPVLWRLPNGEVVPSRDMWGTAKPIAYYRPPKLLFSRILEGSEVPPGRIVSIIEFDPGDIFEIERDCVNDIVWFSRTDDELKIIELDEYWDNPVIPRDEELSNEIWYYDEMRRASHPRK